MVHCEGVEMLYQHVIGPIREMVDSQTICQIYVSTFSTFTLKLTCEHLSFPLQIVDGSTGFKNMLVYIEKNAECPAHIINRIGRFQYDDGQPLQEKIYQIFV